MARARSRESAARPWWSSGVGRIVAGAVLVLVVAVAIGLIALWPRGDLPPVQSIAGGGTVNQAVVTAVASVGCR